MDSLGKHRGPKASLLIPNSGPVGASIPKSTGCSEANRGPALSTARSCSSECRSQIQQCFDVSGIVPNTVVSEAGVLIPGTANVSDPETIPSLGFLFPSLSCIYIYLI